MSFGIYLLIMVLLYALIVLVSKSIFSTVAVLGVHKVEKSLDSIRIFAVEFGSWIHGERLIRRLSRWAFAREYGLTWRQLYLLEHGFKISSDALMNFLIAFGEVELYEDRYILTEESYLFDWCDELCDKIKAIEQSEIPEDVDLEPLLTLPTVYEAPPCTFDDYIFRGKPMLCFFTSIVLEKSEVPAENVEKGKNSD